VFYVGHIDYVTLSHVVILSKHHHSSSSDSSSSDSSSDSSSSSSDSDSSSSRSVCFYVDIQIVDFITYCHFVIFAN
jgi:hypothetical protein